MRKANHPVIYHDRFVRAHGTHPRGQGSWAFCLVEHADRDDYLDFVFWTTGLYSDAKRAAAAHFPAGSRVVVLS